MVGKPVIPKSNKEAKVSPKEAKLLKPDRQASKLAAKPKRYRPGQYPFYFPENMKQCLEKISEIEGRKSIHNAMEWAIWQYIRKHPDYDQSWEQKDTPNKPKEHHLEGEKMLFE